MRALNFYPDPGRQPAFDNSGSLRRKLPPVSRQSFIGREFFLEQLPKFKSFEVDAVSQVVEYIKGESAIYIARNFAERRRNFVG